MPPKNAAESGKRISLDCANLLFLCANSRFAQPRSSLKKVLIVAVRSCSCGALIRGLQNLGVSCKGDVFTFFLRRAKRINKHARTCKKLPVASFCASETAETGRIANGREQGDHVSRRRRSPANSIQSSAGSNFAKSSGGFCRNRFCLQNGSVKALNRCERVTVQLTQDRCFRKRIIVLQAYSRVSQMKFAAAR